MCVYDVVMPWCSGTNNELLNKNVCVRVCVHQHVHVYARMVTAYISMKTYDKHHACVCMYVYVCVRTHCNGIQFDEYI
jgi:hypothetical protein